MKQTLPGEREVTFSYDRNLVTERRWTGPFSARVSRDADHGRVRETELAGNVPTTSGYNAFGELASRSASVDAAAVYEASYSRDAVGRITDESSTVDGTTRERTYRYDAAGRLHKVLSDGDVIHRYDYGPNGNRTGHVGPDGTTTGAYDAQDRLTRYGNTDYSYNAAGDLTKTEGPEGTTTYDYDAQNNLRSVTLPDDTSIDYVIDGRNRRVGKKVDGELTKAWVYKDQLNPVAQLDGAGNVTHRFIYGAKPNVPAYLIKDGTTYRIISDHLGSVRLVINTETGAIAQRLDYSPFGKVTTDTNPGFQPFGFAGGLYDPDTDLVRFGARDYDPETGRWTTKDPLGLGGGSTNFYGYVTNDPVQFIDPAGLARFPPHYFDDDLGRNGGTLVGKEQTPGPVASNGGLILGVAAGFTPAPGGRVVAGAALARGAAALQSGFRLASARYIAARGHLAADDLAFLTLEVGAVPGAFSFFSTKYLTSSGENLESTDERETCVP